MSSDYTPHVVFVNGCFDILHKGHIELLDYAKSLGTHLVVGIDSDSRVREMKGLNRPINTQEDRQFLLEALECVDRVCVFSSDEELENLVKNVDADTMIVGEEYKDKKVIGHRPEISLLFFPKVNGYSTTKTLEDTANR